MLVRNALGAFGLAVALSACGSAPVAPPPVATGASSPKIAGGEDPAFTPVQWCGNAQDCERGCQVDHPRSCARWGDMLGGGHGVARDPAKAKSTREHGCKLGDSYACYQLARTVANTGGSGADVAAAAGRACDVGSGGACSMLAFMAKSGLGIDKDEPRADRLLAQAVLHYDKECEGGDAASCAGLASLVSEGRGTPADPARGKALQQRALELAKERCAASDVLSCRDIASDAMMDTMIAERDLGKSVAVRAFTRACELNDGSSCELLALQDDVDEKESLALRAKACSLNDVDGCVESAKPDDNDKGTTLLRSDCTFGIGEACDRLATGLIEQHAKPAETDPLAARARTLQVAACKTGFGDCFRAANMVDQGFGGPEDPKEAVALLDIPCRSSGVCGALGDRLIESDDTADRKRALELFERECSAHTEECPKLAKLFEEGKVVKKDPKRARQLFAKVADEREKRCNAGEAIDCANLAEMYELGEGVKKDPKKAEAFGNKACSLGLKVGCDDDPGVDD